MCSSTSGAGLIASASWGVGGKSRNRRPLPPRGGDGARREGPHAADRAPPAPPPSPARRSRGLAAQAIRRNRAEQQITRTRAALIKLVLASQQAMGEETMVRLSLEHPSVAYHCGRLLAVLEEVQRLAIPGIKATVVDKFFGTASSAPVAVFPRILAGRAHTSRSCSATSRGCTTSCNAAPRRSSRPSQGFPAHSRL